MENVPEKKINHISLYVHIYDLSFVITKGHLSFILTTPKKVSIETDKFRAIIKNDLNELSADEVYSIISKK